MISGVPRFDARDLYDAEPAGSEGRTLVNPDALVQQLKSLDTCSVSDALDYFGLPGALTGIGPMWECGRVAGRILTVTLDVAKSAGPVGPHLGATAISLAMPGEVIVVDNRAGAGVAAGWGGLLALAAKLKGVAGVIVYGAVRDIDDIAEVQLPIFAHGITTRTARGRIVEIASGAPIEFGDVRVQPGDYAVADRSGVVFISADRCGEVLDKAAQLAEREAEMANQLRTGGEAIDVLAGNYERMLDKRASDE